VCMRESKRERERERTSDQIYQHLFFFLPCPLLPSPESSLHPILNNILKPILLEAIFWSREDIYRQQNTRDRSLGFDLCPLSEMEKSFPHVHAV